MSVTKEQLQKDLEILNANKEIAVQNYNQIIGAISALTQLIAHIEGKEGDIQNGEIIEQS